MKPMIPLQKFKEVIDALEEAVGLTNVPDYIQDNEWRAQRDKCMEALVRATKVLNAAKAGK